MGPKAFNDETFLIDPESNLIISLSPIFKKSRSLLDFLLIYKEDLSPNKLIIESFPSVFFCAESLFDCFCW